MKQPRSLSGVAAYAQGRPESSEVLQSWRANIARAPEHEVVSHANELFVRNPQAARVAAESTDRLGTLARQFLEAQKHLKSVAKPTSKDLSVLVSLEPGVMAFLQANAPSAHRPTVEAIAYVTTVHPDEWPPPKFRSIKIRKKRKLFLAICAALPEEHRAKVPLQERLGK